MEILKRVAPLAMVLGFLNVACSSSGQLADDTTRSTFDFSLISPSDETNIGTADPLLVWSDSAGEDSYKVEVSGDEAFDSSITWTINPDVSFSSIPSGILVEGQSYYWRVSAQQDGKSGIAQNAPYRFYLLAPGDFELIGPTDGETLVGSSEYVFSWSDSNDESEYQLEISESNDFSNSIKNTNDANQTWASIPGSLLTKGITYHWRVVAVGEGGRTFAGPASFTVAPDPPESFSLVAPLDAAFLYSDADLDWPDVTGAESYTVEISSDSGFSTIDYTVAAADSEHAVPGGSLSLGVSYYWRVVATNPGGSSTSNIQTLTLSQFTGWSYRLPVDISNSSGSDITDSAVQLSLDTAALIGSGKLETDCRDLRVVDLADESDLGFWLESGCNTVTTNVIVNLDNLTDGDTANWALYYGNSTAIDSSDQSTVATTLESGIATLSDSIDGGTSQSIVFSETKTNPVVVSYIHTRNNGESVASRVSNVLTTGFDVFMEEPDNGSHAAEDVSWLAVASGSWQSIDGSFRIESGSYNTASTHAGGSGFSPETVSYDQNFSGTPSVMATINSYNNTAFATTHVSAVASSNFGLQQEIAQAGTATVNEDIGWIAVERSSGTTSGIAFNGGYVATDGSNDGVTNTAAPISYSFAALPALIVQGCTPNGADGYWARGAGTYSNSAHTLYAEEDQVGDSERVHADEAYCWFGIDDAANLPLIPYLNSPPGQTWGSEISL